MENVLRFVYLPRYNQKSIINEHRISKHFPSSLSIIECAKKNIEQVVAKDSENGIILGIAFMNTVANLVYHGIKPRRDNLSLMIFPIYGIVDYKFKKLDDIFVNQGTDPRVILKGGRFTASEWDSQLFFTKNPFENLDFYKGIGCFLPDATGNMDLADMMIPRKEIIRRYLEEKALREAGKK